MPCPTECRKFGLKHVYFGTLDELAMRQHARHGIVDGAAETTTLRRHVNEGYRPLFDACVLIHVRPRAFWSNHANEIIRRRAAALAVARPWPAARALRGSGSQFQGWRQPPRRSPPAFRHYESRPRRRRAPTATA